MSDIQEDVDWWQAADGRWYPPELMPTEEPDEEPALPAHPYGRFNRVLKPRETKPDPSPGPPPAPKQPIGQRLATALPKPQLPKRQRPSMLPSAKGFIIGIGVLILVVGLAISSASNSDRPTSNSSSASSSNNNTNATPGVFVSIQERNADIPSSFGNTRKVANDWYVSVGNPTDLTGLVPLNEPNRDDLTPVLIPMEITYTGADQVVVLNEINATLVNEELSRPCELNGEQPQAVLIVRDITAQHSVCMWSEETDLSQIAIQVVPSTRLERSVPGIFQTNGSLAQQSPPTSVAVSALGEAIQLDVWSLQPEISRISPSPQFPGLARVELVTTVTYTGTASQGTVNLKLYAFGSALFPTQENSCVSSSTEVIAQNLRGLPGERIPVATCFLVPDEDVDDLLYIFEFDDYWQTAVYFQEGN